MNRPFAQFRDKTLEEFAPRTPSQKEALDIVQRYIEDREKNLRSGWGLLLTGKPGVGKTFLANMVLKACQEKGESIEAFEMSAFIELFLERFALQHREESDQRYYEIQDHIHRIRTKTQWVLFDDIGREHESASGWSNEQLFNVFRYRYDRGRPTLFTTNFNLDELGTRCSEGFISQIGESCHVIAMESNDYRWTKDE